MLRHILNVDPLRHSCCKMKRCVSSERVAATSRRLRIERIHFDVDANTTHTAKYELHEDGDGKNQPKKSKLTLKYQI